MSRIWLWRGVIVVGAVIVAAGVAHAQGQTRDPSPPERPAPSEEAAPSVRWIRSALSGVAQTSGSAEIGSRFWMTPVDFGARRFSADSSGNTSFGPVNPNAPWKVSGGFTYASDNGTVARIGVVGHRNYRMPLFMHQAIGSGQDLTLPLASFSDLSQRRVQWELSTGIEQTFIRTAAGRTIGAVGDVFVPLNRASPRPGAADQPVLPSIAGRVGVKFGF